MNPTGMLDITAEPCLRREPNLFWRIRLRAGINVLN